MFKGARGKRRRGTGIQGERGEVIEMLPTPKSYTLVAAAAEGEKELTAFDRALLLAGIGNVNLVRVSSILPPGAEYREKLNIPPGSLVPIAYGSLSSTEPGALIAAAVAVGVGPDAGSFGVIMVNTSRNRLFSCFLKVANGRCRGAVVNTIAPSGEKAQLLEPVLEFAHILPLQGRSCFI